MSNGVEQLEFGVVQGREGPERYCTRLRLTFAVPRHPTWTAIAEAAEHASGPPVVGWGLAVETITLVGPDGEGTTLSWKRSRGLGEVMVALDAFTADYARIVAAVLAQLGRGGRKSDLRDIDDVDIERAVRALVARDERPTDEAISREIGGTSHDTVYRVRAGRKPREFLR